MLETDRLILRPPERRDLAAVREQLSNYEIAKWLAKVPHPYPADHEETWWARVEERRTLGFPPYHMMTLKEGGGDEAIGCIAVSPAGEKVFRIGYWLGEPWWGKGVMSEAVSAVIDHTFDELGASAMVAGYFEGNEGSAAILRKQGFEDVDVTREWCEARQESLAHINLILKH